MLQNFIILGVGIIVGYKVHIQDSIVQKILPKVLFPSSPLSVG